MEQGEVIRKLRIERGMSQNMLAKDISTRSTLSSFECRQTKLSSSILLKYLNRLNVKFDEFQFLIQDNQLNDKEIITNIFLEMIEFEFEKNEVISFLKDLKCKYENTRDNFYLMISSQLTILKAKILKISGTIVKNEIRKVKNYLFNVENWCHFELSIFSNLLFIFNSEEIIIQFDNVIPKMWVLKDLTQYNYLISTFLINGCFVGFEREDPIIIRLFLTYLETVTNNPRFIEAKIYAIIFKGLQSIIYENKNDLFAVTNGIRILETLNNKKALKMRNFVIKSLEKKGYELNVTVL